MKKTIPHGFWPSDWSAAQAAAASRDFAELRAAHGGVLWVEYRPEEARCALWRYHEGRAHCLTPATYSVRSRVYEYGGGAFCATPGGVAFVNEADQQVYLQPLDGLPRALTDREHCRYGDLHYDRLGACIVAVEETHGGGTVEHRLVTISLDDGTRRIAFEGADFYASPVLSGAGDQLAWIEWDRPDQPWTRTRLGVAHRSANGIWQPAGCVAGTAPEESLQQPRFNPRGELVCLGDRGGYWQPWQASPQGWAPRIDAPFDHAAAPWQLGASSYLVYEAALLACRFEAGRGVLLEYRDGRERRLAEDFSRFRSLAMDDRYFYSIAAAEDRLPAVIAIDRHEGSVRVLAGGDQPFREADLSRPLPLDFTVRSERAHGFFYAPANADCTAPTATRPPLVMFLHGGPTSASYPVFDPRIQFWTQRGFAVFDLNYRGSAGFGRAYRERLREAWGVVDVEDAAAAVAFLASADRVDGTRAFIRGGSAGGYTALAALAFTDAFHGGASLYGVSDPLALGRVTHKFEGDYLDWLIGDPQSDAERYAARAPLQHAARIRSPVIFFQGGLDAVVVPAQTQSMVAALRANGVEAECHLYPDERHGFRRAEHLAEVMEKELAFYQRLL